VGEGSAGGRSETMGVGFVIKVGFKPGVKERWSYRCAKWWIKRVRSDGWRNGWVWNGGTGIKKEYVPKMQAWCICSKTVWSMPERFEIYIVYKWRYINTLPFLFILLPEWGWQRDAHGGQVNNQRGCCTGDADKHIHFDGYQVSNQCMALVADDCLIPTRDAPELGYVKESTNEQYVPDVFYKVRIACHYVSRTNNTGFNSQPAQPPYPQ